MVWCIVLFCGYSKYCIMMGPYAERCYFSLCCALMVTVWLTSWVALIVFLPQNDLRVIETTQPVCFLQLLSPPVRYCFSWTCTCDTAVVASSPCLLLHWATSQLPAAITAWGACHSAGNNLSKSMDCFLKRQSDFKQRAVGSSLSRLHWRVWIQGQTF